MIIAAAILHDVVEDTDENIDHFPQEVQKIVHLLSNPSDKNVDRRFDAIHRICNYPEAILVKRADRYANISEENENSAQYWAKPDSLENTWLLLEVAKEPNIQNTDLYQYLIHKKSSGGIMQPTKDISQISSSGICQICNQEISRRSYLKHLETCLLKEGRQTEQEPSVVIHVKANADSRYYLIIMARPDATFYDLNTIFQKVLRSEGDPSSRFQFRDHYYFSHMNDGFPGMNTPIFTSPLMHERFLYLLYSGGWFPSLLTGEIIGEIPYSPRGGNMVEIVAMNIMPEEHHRWPQHPDKSL